MAENSLHPFCLRASYRMLTVRLRQPAADQPMRCVNPGRLWQLAHVPGYIGDDDAESMLAQGELAEVERTGEAQRGVVAGHRVLHRAGRQQARFDDNSQRMLASDSVKSAMPAIAR